MKGKKNKPLFSGMLKDGFSQSERLCLKSSACHHVTFDAAGAGKYGIKTSWSISGPLLSLDKEEANYARRIAYGDGKDGKVGDNLLVCTFTTRDGGATEGCPYMCVEGKASVEAQPPPGGGDAEYE